MRVCATCLRLTASGKGTKPRCRECRKSDIAITSRKCTKCGGDGPFSPEPRNWDGLQSRCRACCAAACKTRYLANPARYREYQRQYHYGISDAERAAMFARQSGRCGICECKMVLGGRNAITANLDHDHTTNEVRGLLCSRCNQGIGLLREDPAIMQRAIEYIKRKPRLRLIVTGKRDTRA